MVEDGRTNGPGTGAETPTGCREDAFDRVRNGGAWYALDAELAVTCVSERARGLLMGAGDCRNGADGTDVDTDRRTAAVRETLESGFHDAHERALESRRPTTAEAAVGASDGDGDGVGTDDGDRWLEARCFPDETGITVLLSDITERTERERGLEAGNRRLRSIFENAHDAILVGDEDEITAANPAASELFDLDRSELYGRSLREFVHDDHDVDSAWGRLVERGRLRGSFSIVRDDGTERVVEFNAVANVLPGTHLSILRDVTETRERERQLEAQRERLTALDHVNSVVREITEAIVTGSTRTDLERAACESLAESRPYEFAFVAEVDTGSGTIHNRVEAGIEGYVDSIPLSIDENEPAGRGPAGRALRTGEMQTSNDVFSDPAFEPWREDARERGYESAAAIPIVHDGVVYGVLGVTSARRNAFTDEERGVIGQLGGILGHAIAAVERRRVLLGDELIELELVVDDAVALFDGPEPADPVRFDRVVRVGDDRYLEYGTTTAETFPTLESLVTSIPHWTDVAVIDRSAGNVAFELTIDSPPMFGVIDAHGGTVEAAVLEDGDYATTLRFPTGTDIRAVIDAISDVYPGTRTVARRHVEPSSTSVDQLETGLTESLTDRQQTALEAAYYSGYFAWPRDSSGEEIADSMGVTPPTFHEHLRAAQNKLVAAFVDEPRPTQGERSAH